jgi:type IV secretory pathway TraG/TraD family ATPase VirD4
VFVVLPEDKAKIFHRFTRLVYESSFRALLKSPPAPVYFIMDELATSLGDAQQQRVEMAMSLGRAAGVRVHAFFQNYAQMKTIFKDNAGSVESAAGVMQFFQPNDEDTFKKMQSLGGTFTKWETMTSFSDGSTTNRSAGNGSGSTSTSHNTSTSEQALKMELIDPSVAYGLGTPDEGNDFTARQILFFRGLRFAPAVSTRRSYWMDATTNAELAPNPYAPKT